MRWECENLLEDFDLVKKMLHGLMYGNQMHENPWIQELISKQ